MLILRHYAVSPYIIYSQINHIIVINHASGYRLHTFNNPLWLCAIIGFLYMLDSKAMSVANQKYFTDFHQQLFDSYVMSRHASYIIKNMQNLVFSQFTLCSLCPAHYTCQSLLIFQVSLHSLHINIQNIFLADLLFIRQCLQVDVTLSQ